MAMQSTCPACRPNVGECSISQAYYPLPSMLPPHGMLGKSVLLPTAHYPPCSLPPLQVPACAKLALQALDDGHCVVVGLQSTGESNTTQQLDLTDELNDLVSAWLGAPCAKPCWGHMVKHGGNLGCMRK